MYISQRGRGFGQTTTNAGWGYISPCGSASGSPSAQSAAAQQQAAQTMGWIGAAIVGGIVLWGLFGGGGQ